MKAALAIPGPTACAPPSPRDSAIPEGLAVVVEADLVEASRLQAQFRRAGVDAMIGGKECCSAGGCGPKAAVLVPIADLPRVREILDANWAALVANAGDPSVLARIAAAEAEGEPVCPACGHVGEPVAGECADCGLTLG